jgi:membrane-bound ClpP family serine protease
MLPVGLFIFAWTCVPVHIHWIVCMIGLLCFGSGMVLIFLATQNYLVDAYLPTAASVMAAGTVTRSIIGVVLPLFTLNMYDALGINWASCVVAFIALVFTPVPVLLFVYGRRIRRLTKHGRMSDDHYLALAEARTVLVREKTREGDAEMASRIPPINDIDEENDDPVLEDNLSERFANGVL